MFAKKEFSIFSNERQLKIGEEASLEDEVTLLGVTALEDLLQEDCKQCINDFRAAKIKVWMLTGDKGETAQTIGNSCGIIDEDSQDILKISALSASQITQETDLILQTLKKKTANGKNEGDQNGQNIHHQINNSNDNQHRDSLIQSLTIQRRFSSK